MRQGYCSDFTRDPKSVLTDHTAHEATPALSLPNPPLNPNPRRSYPALGTARSLAELILSMRVRVRVSVRSLAELLDVDVGHVVATDLEPYPGSIIRGQGRSPIDGSTERSDELNPNLNSYDPQWR